MGEPRRARPALRRRGLTLVEVMLSVAILGAALAPLVYAVLGQARSSKDLEGRLRAQALLGTVLETVAALPFEELDRVPGPGGAARLPPVGDGLRLEVAVEPVPGVDPRLLRRVRVTVRWELEGRLAAAAPRQVLVRELLVPNRKVSLTHDGSLR